ncbi:hypothetical protein [Zunongwangia sp. H14]|uniref:hypothetical protein n=1 Tax=Zunongwangia sp. H14 TaxID=3240792 RepID=UPI0035684AF7
MRGKLKKEGKHELFRTTHGNQILNLDDKDFYALVEGQKGDVIVLSDEDHKKQSSLSKGKYYYADFQDDPEFQDMRHLFMEDGNKFRELILPEGLPTKSDTQKKLIRESKKLSKEKILEHVKGKGNKGSEKQYSDNKEGLREKNKEELYDMGRKEGISGRSKMDKEELVKKLSKKKN